MTESRNLANSTTLAANALIYLGTSMLNKAIPFLALPVLTVYLTPAGYGLLANALVLVELFVIFIGLNCQAWLKVQYFKLERVLLLGSIRFTLLQLGVLTVVAFLVSSVLLEFLPSVPRTYLLIPLIAGLQIVPMVALTLWQCEHNAQAFARVSLLLTSINFGLSILLIVAFDFGWEGRLYGVFMANLVGTVLTVVLLSRRGVYRAPMPANELRRDQLKYGGILVPTALAWWARTGVDRFILSAFVGMSAVGIYTAALQVSMIVMVVADSMNQALAPSLFERLREDEGNPRHIYYLVAVTAIVLTAAYLGLWLLTPALNLVLGAHFHPAIPLIRVLALSYVFHGVTLCLNGVLYYFSRVRLLSTITVVGSTAHMVLALYMARQYGLDGIVLALPISSIIMLVLSIVAATWVWRSDAGKS